MDRALGGHHPTLIRVHLDHVTLLDLSVAAVEDEVEAALDAIREAWGISADGIPSPAPGPDAAYLAGAYRNGLMAQVVAFAARER